MLIRIREKNQDSRDVPLAAADAFAKTSSERCASGTTPPVARHPAPTKASVFARSRPCSYACQSRGTRARAASRPRGRLSRGRAGTRTRTRPRLLFPAHLRIASTAIRARPADSRLGRRVASVDVRRARDEPDSSRDRRRRAESSRGPSRGSRGARVSTSRVCHGTPISLVGSGSSRACPIGRPPARALGLGIAKRARRSRTTIVSSPLARLAFSARARSLGSTSANRLVVLPSSDPGRSSRWKYPRGPWPLARISVRKSAVTRGLNQPAEPRARVFDVQQRVSSTFSACRRRPSHPSTRQPPASRLPPPASASRLPPPASASRLPPPTSASRLPPLTSP